MKKEVSFTQLTANSGEDNQVVKKVPSCCISTGLETQVHGALQLTTFNSIHANK